MPLWWPYQAQDKFQTPLGVWVGPGAVWLSYGPLSDQITTRLVPRISGIKVQLLCGVKIEPA